MKPLHDLLTAEKALVFRITHRENLRWALSHGLQCPVSPTLDPNFSPIGAAHLIDKRRNWNVPLPQAGTLGEYVPFYLTPCSMMLYNIVTGYAVTRQQRGDIITLVSSVERLRGADVEVVIADGHALSATTRYSRDDDALGAIDWEILRARDFSRSVNDPGKQVRYQAEVLARHHVPADALIGIGCVDAVTERKVAAVVASCAHEPRIVCRPEWFFL